MIQQLKKLGEICNFINGRAFKPTEWSNKRLPIIRIQNLNNEVSHYNFCNFEVPEKIHVKNGDLLVSRSGTPGTSFGAFIWKGGNAVLNQHIFKTEIDDKIVNKYYLKSAINNILDEMISRAHGGAGLKHINKGELENIEIPLPPLPTKHAIVARLDEASETIQATKSAIQDQIDALDTLWQSSLSKVFDENSTNAVEIKNVIKKTNQINPTNKADEVFTYIDISAVDKDTQKITSPNSFIGLQAPSRAKKEIQKGDIVFATTRPNLKNIAIINEDYVNPVASTGFCVLRVDTNTNRDYLFYFLTTKNIQDQIEPFIRGAQYPAISDKDLLSCKIPLPSSSRTTSHRSGPRRALSDYQ